MRREDDAVPPQKRNMVYLPLGNATPDYFIGRRRPFDDKYGSSIVALDITSGEQGCSFQTVHHDQWDFDLPVGPSLVDLPGPSGGVISALLQTTKQGQIFLLNRENGTPIAAVEERPQGRARPAGFTDPAVFRRHAVAYAGQAQ
ncbi:hypothetical protein FXB40_03440 [Bradyrhizobium rifense]|uniref:Pyrrolo-quinoline quinone repeat domain-containing protein n=1 Tax=Bradyrhizobium rifense TaxID=515499 RepID=A0A5D3KN14_9BRAD|nr:hypothetical protein [Bradyrhizobium rifense]TYL99178.1 hypothetical protein FXB40_03440 [Bradyrhizobium rifense]